MGWWLRVGDIEEAVVRMLSHERRIKEKGGEGGERRRKRINW